MQGFRSLLKDSILYYYPECENAHSTAIMIAGNKQVLRGAAFQHADALYERFRKLEGAETLNSSDSVHCRRERDYKWFSETSYAHIARLDRFQWPGYHLRSLILNKIRKEQHKEAINQS